MFQPSSTKPKYLTPFKNPARSAFEARTEKSTMRSANPKMIYARINA